MANRKELIGEVISAYQKTVVVKVERLVSHPLYLKRVKKFTKYYAHDEDMKSSVGDTVRIVETKPLSKLKRWRVVEVIGGGEE